MLSTLMYTNHSKLLLRKICRVALVLMLVNGMWVIVDICDWYLYLVKSPRWLLHDKYFLFTHIIWPAAAGIELILSTIAYVANYKGYQLLHAGFENEDPVLINKGFKNLFSVLVLIVITFAMGIMCTGYRIFILK